ncbi:MAG: acylneuraminate cytidylyltransferase family protein [Anaerolineaceae bacterium]|nr:MAG: acylneuraminate cytidylyltransferase family protein [Anaerolineaceae bacterium]
MSNYVVGVIFARGGSKGIPRKNLRLLAGKPLIAYAINTALASNLIDRVVVSTDDREIAAVAQEYGAEIPFMRPAELAQDDSPEWLAWQHAIRELKLVGSGLKRNIFVCIPPTSPLRTVENVDACILELLETDADLVITVKPADRNPYFNMVMLDAEGCARLVIPVNKEFHHRQAAPQVYDMTTVAYAARPEFVLQAKSMFEGKVRTVVVPPEQAVDIDSELDFKLAEFLLSKSSSH